MIDVLATWIDEEIQDLRDKGIVLYFTNDEELGQIELARDIETGDFRLTIK